MFVCFQVADLAMWRQALVERSYDQQCDKLTWGTDGACSVDNVSKNATLSV